MAITIQTVYKKIQSDWLEADPNDPSFILNKPVLDATNLTAGTGIDITGIFPDFTISAENTNAIWNANALQDFSISTTDPTNGQVLTYNSGLNMWEAQTPAPPNPGTVTEIDSYYVNGNAAVVVGGPISSSGDLIHQWLGDADQIVLGNGNLADLPINVNLTAGTGISLTGTYPNLTINNTLPDQIVTLTGAGATSISGTYPNFTISSVNTTYTAGTGISIVGNVISSTISPANNGMLTINSSGIASGSGTFTANQSTNTTVTINVPATNLGSSVLGSNVTITSSTGTGTTFAIPPLAIPNQQIVYGTGPGVTSSPNFTYNGTVLTVSTSSATVDPVVNAGGTVANGSYSYRLTNGFNHSNLFLSGGNNTFLLDTIQGDSGIANSLASRSILLGATGNTSWLKANATGITCSSLAGTGTRMVVANSSGLLSTQAIVSQVVLTAGTGISITGTYPNLTINNTAPDQVVTITGGGATTVGGSYPNFTISSVNTLPNNGLLSIATSGIATGSGTFSANQSTNSNITITVPGTNLSSSVLGNTLTINSSTGAGTSIALPVPSWQAVTDVGNTTTNNLFVGNPGIANDTGAAYQTIYGSAVTEASPMARLNLVNIWNGQQYIASMNAAPAGTLGQASAGLRFKVSHYDFGSAAPVIFDSLLLDSDGGATLPSLAGVGTRMMVADLNGKFGTQAIPSNVNLIAGTGISVTGSYPNLTVTNTLPDQVVTLTGTGATNITGTYPNFTINSVNTTYTAGTGLSLVGTTFNNTAPDQTVVLTNSGGATVTGTYPNFNISSSNFAINDLTFNADRTHNLAGFGVQFNNASVWNVLSTGGITLNNNNASRLIVSNSGVAIRTGAQGANLRSDNLTLGRIHQLPDANGIYVLTINGVGPNNQGNITLADTNFANTNLLFSGNRSHDANSNSLDITNASTISMDALSSIIFSRGDCSIQLIGSIDLQSEAGSYVSISSDPIGPEARLTTNDLTAVRNQEFQDYDGQIESLMTDTPTVTFVNCTGSANVVGTAKFGTIQLTTTITGIGSGAHIMVEYATPYITQAIAHVQAVVDCTNPDILRIDSGSTTEFRIFLTSGGSALIAGATFSYIVNGY